MRRPPAIAVILLGYLTLGLLYSVLGPILESSDELWHYPVVKHLADGKGLAVQPPPENYQWRQQGNQPPLYYALMALATFWIDTGDPAQIAWVNPHAKTGWPHAPDNKNMVIHTAAEDFPYQGVSLAVHLIRLLSVMMGAAAVYLTYRIARETFPLDPSLAIGAAAVHAFVPMFLFISASVDNDNLAVPLASLALWLLVRLVRHGFTTGRTIALGITLGFAVLSKLSTLGLLPLALAALGYRAYRDRRWEPLAKGTVGMLVPALAISGWWFGRNVVLYGEPTGLASFLDIAGLRDPTPAPWELLPELEGLLISFWALLGAANILVAEQAYLLWNALSVLALIGLGLYGVKAWRNRQRETLAPLTLLALWFLILFASLVRWTQLTWASLGRLLFPSLAAIAVLLFLGLASLVPRRFHGLLAGFLGVGGFLFALAVPFLYVLPAYPGPMLLSEGDLAEVEHPLRLRYEDKVELVGYGAEKTRYRPGDPLRITLYWRALRPLEENYSIYLHLFGSDREPLGQEDTYPGLGTYPTTLWRPGEIVKDTYTAFIAPTATVPSALLVEAGPYRLEGFAPLQAYDAQGTPVGPQVGRFKLAARGETTPGPFAPVDINLGGKVRLVGYQREPTAPKSGTKLRLALLWESLEALDADYTVFLHLFGPGPQGKLWSQTDRQPRKGNYPTSLWEPGERIQDAYELAIPIEAPPGEYRLVLGMYRWPEMAHLLVGPEGSATALLTVVRVEGP